VPSLSADDRAGIEQAADAYVAAMNAADWQRVAQSFSEDAVRIPPNEEPHQGRDAIERWLIGIEELGTYELKRDRIEGGDGIAYVRGRYDITLRPVGSPVSLSDQGASWRSGARGTTACGASPKRCGTRASRCRPDRVGRAFGRHSRTLAQANGVSVTLRSDLFAVMVLRRRDCGFVPGVLCGRPPSWSETMPSPLGARVDGAASQVDRECDDAAGGEAASVWLPALTLLLLLKAPP